LLPSVFVAPHVKGIDEPNYQPTIIYPANGALTLWGEPATSDQLEALLGAQTARVLTLLHAPRTTRELAAHLHLPESGASYHLSKLREAGLLESQRHGRWVYHARSSRGEALVELFS
jgi:predicted transcriptional regulator